MKTSVQHKTMVKKASKLLGCLKAEAEKDAGSIKIPLRTPTAASLAGIAAVTSGWHT